MADKNSGIQVLRVFQTHASVMLFDVTPLIYVFGSSVPFSVYFLDNVPSVKKRLGSTELSYDSYLIKTSCNSSKNISRDFAY